MLADDIDPGMAKQLKKRAKKLGPENSFEAVAREWHIKFCSKWTEEHGATILHRLEKAYFERFDNREQARRSIFEYVEMFYNNQRRHSTVGYLSPAEFERRYYQQALCS